VKFYTIDIENFLSPQNFDFMLKLSQIKKHELIKEIFSSKAMNYFINHKWNKKV